MLFCLYPSLTAQVYVDLDANGANNGTSWANAYTDLQAALANTNSGEIWVATGTYTPTNCFPCGTPDREISFELKNNVALYGGFAGNETTLNQRDFSANPTILSGEIGSAGNADNTLQVVRGTNIGPSAILDGFIVEAGNADGAGGTSTNFGGGITLDGSFVGVSSPVIQNCTIRNNTASGGGGMAIYCTAGGTSAALINNCTFDNNTASINSVSFGGGVLIIGSTGAQLTAQFSNCTFTNNFTGTGGDGAALAATPSGSLLALQLVNCVFDGNTSSDRAGAVLLRVSDDSIGEGENQSVFSNCTFTNNSANGEAGAVYDRASFGAVGQTQYIDCQFTGNTSGERGGALFLRGSQESQGQIGINNAVLQGCTFQNNSAGQEGGAVFVYSWLNGECNPTFQNNTISNNTAALQGGGVYIFGEDNSAANPVLTNNEITGNASTTDNGGGIGLRMESGSTGSLTISGGAIYCSGALNGGSTGACEPEIVNNTFYGNSAGSGNGLYAAFADPLIANNIFWDGGSEIAGNDHNPTVSDCIVEGGYNGPGTVISVLSDDPLFIDPDNSNFRLTACSPAVNAGDNASIPDDLADMDGDNNTTEIIPIDLDGQSRISAGTVDMGAYERAGGGATLDLTVQTSNVSCAGASTMLDAGAFDSYLWSTNETTPTITVTEPGTYSVTVADDDGCEGETSVTVVEQEGPQPQINGDLHFCDGEETFLSAGGFTAYEWSKYLFAGLSVEQAIPSDVTFEGQAGGLANLKRELHYHAMLGARFYYGNDYDYVEPVAWGKLALYAPVNLLVGTRMTFSEQRFWGGLAVSSAWEGYFQFGLTVLDNWRIGYANSMFLAQTFSASAGMSHEVSVSFRRW